MGGLAWIEADVQVSNFHNNNLRNNFWGGYLINFNNGIPTPEEQGDIERQIKRKFSGTDNAGRFVVTFNDDVNKAPTLEPLTPSDMDKQFEILNKTVQQEIFQKGGQDMAQKLINSSDDGPKFRYRIVCQKETYMEMKQQHYAILKRLQHGASSLKRFTDKDGEVGNQGFHYLRYLNDLQ